MVNAITVFLLATAVSAGVIRRNVTQILSDLQAIDTATNSLTSTVNDWDGSVLGALTIETATTAIGDLVDTATTDAKAEPVASSADSQTVLDYINETAEPDIAASLAALEARVSDFQTDGITSLVVSSLQSLQTKNDALGTALVAITSSDEQSAAQDAVAKIDADFAAAIATFS